MHFKTRNVNTAFYQLVSDFANPREAPFPIIESSSRNGKVWMAAEPILVTYERPLERVLFNDARDANPFFHVFEALWMLAGRNDLSPLTKFVSTFGQFSDDGKTLNGAYGYRWRHAGPPLAKVEKYYDEKENHPYGNWPDSIDQLEILIEHLKANPDSRRAVLQMWNVEDDLTKINVQDTTTEVTKVWKTFAPPSKDVCCNLSAMFSIRRDDKLQSMSDDATKARGVSYLDMTVTNRSNDLIWGMLGANYVHFSFLQEYMAARLGVAVGTYSQFTNNLHAYEWNFKPAEWLAFYNGDSVAEQYWYSMRRADGTYPVRIHLVKDASKFGGEVKWLVDHLDHVLNGGNLDLIREPFLQTVAAPMLQAFGYAKRKEYAHALERAQSVADDAWRKDSLRWIRARQSRSEAKAAVQGAD